ncbi:hypothetical protein B0J17DRAFT_226756 [Rhizoctonia solani]|nr:hypothetical protein B0J17DRAFT_226756 [Rhizoctonia solani]
MHLTRSEALAEQVTEMLIRYMKGETDMEPLMPQVLSVCLVLLCRKMVTNRVGSIKHVQKLIRAYQSQTSHNSDEVRIKMERERDRDLQSQSILAFILGAISILNDNCTVEDSPCFSDRLPDDSQPMSPLLTSERVMEMTWKYLIAHVYLGTYSFGERRYALHGGFHLLMRSRDYGLDSNDCMAISKLMDENGAQFHSGSEVDDKCYPRHIQEYIAALAASPDLNALAPQLSTYLKYLRPMADRFQYISLTPEVYAMSLKALCQTNGDWEFADYGRLLLYSPFPKISPRLIDLLSTSGVFSWLVESLDEGGAEQRPFAIAQLWLLFNMSVQAPGPTSDTQSKLEEILLQYPGLENSPEKREEAMMDLETRLFVLLDQNEDTIRYRYVGTYLCRVLECMLQQRCTPLPEWTHEELEHIPGRLRGIGSLVDLEANTSESPSNQNVSLCFFPFAVLQCQLTPIYAHGSWKCKVNQRRPS